MSILGRIFGVFRKPAEPAAGDASRDAPFSAEAPPPPEPAPRARRAKKQPSAGPTAGGFFSGRPLSMSALVEFCRSIRFFLSSGMTIREGMQSLADKGTYRVRGVASELAAELADGWTLEDALVKQGRRFSPLFVALVAVGEETGKLPEVMKDLEAYYELELRQQRQLLGQAIKPIIQYVLASVVVAALLVVISYIPGQKTSGGVKRQVVYEKDEKGRDTNRPMLDSQGKPLELSLPTAYDPLGWGLMGEQGAAIFLAYAFGIPLALYLLYRLVRSVFRGGALVDRIILAVPMVGGAARALALTRFSFAMQLLLDSSMSILKAIRLGFAATGNAAFAAAGPPAEAVLRRGNTIVSAIEPSRLFPKAFLGAAAVGEQTGHLPEVMKHQADYYDEIARRRITTLYTLAGYAVWLTVAVFIAILVIQLFSSYVDKIPN